VILFNTVSCRPPDKYVCVSPSQWSIGPFDWLIVGSMIARYGPAAMIVTTLVAGACKPEQPSGQVVPPPAAADPAPNGSAIAATTPTIVFVGTSLTAGFGLPDPSLAYPALIQHKLDSAGIHLRVVNAGVSGETSAGALRRVDWVLS